MSFNLFFFGKKDNVGKRYSLSKLPLFSLLNDAELNNILKHVRFVEFRKGDIIYRQGDVADAFYVVLSGRCRVYVITAKEEVRTLAYLHQGDYFGEVSLLTEKPHAAHVEAKNDTLVLKVSKKDFFNLINTIPSFSIQISRRLGMRIKKLYEPEVMKDNAKIISLLQLSHESHALRFSLNFSNSVRNETKQDVILINMTIQKDTLVAHYAQKEQISIVAVNEIETFSYNQLKKYIYTHESGLHILNLIGNADTIPDLKLITTFLTDLLTDYKYIIVNTSPLDESIMMSIVEQSDLIYVVSDSHVEGIYQCKRVIDQLRVQFNFTSLELHLILYETYDKKQISIKQKERIVGWKIFSVIPYYAQENGMGDISFKQIPVVSSHPACVYAKTIRFMTRELGGILIGLALGSGAAFGLAHIGVLKVLEREKIHIDIVSGTSIGAVIGALWAGGYSAHDIEKIALGFRKKMSIIQLVDIFDISAPHFGFFKGRTVKRFLNKYLGKREFKDLRMPLRIVATNLATSEDIVFKEGNVVNAVRASISIPGIIKPVSLRGKHIIDGGVTNPLPISLLVDEGVHKIIAVNVLPTPQDLLEAQQYAQMEHEAVTKAIKKTSIFKRFAYSFFRALKKKYEGNIFNVMMNTVQYLEAAVSSMQQTDADIIIHPIVHDSHWAQFYRSGKFIACGEEETLKVIHDIKRLVEE